MAIIQESVIFIDGHTSTKNGVDPTSIEDVFDEEVLRGLMENASTIIMREMRPKLPCLKVYEKVTIPGVIRGDEEEVFVGKSRIDGGSVSIRGKSRNKFGEENHFLALRS
jgi:hypothetical protein